MPPSNNTDPLFQSSKVFLNKQAHPSAPAQMPQGVEPMPSQGGNPSYADIANGGGDNRAWSQYANVADVKGPVSMKAKSISSLTDEQLMEAVNAPLSGEEVAMKLADLQAQGIELTPENFSKAEFEAYDPWREKQHFNFWGAIGEGALQAGKDLGKGVIAGATDWKKIGLAAGLSAVATPAIGFGVAFGATAVEGFARGTRDLGGLAVMAANHPGSPLYRMFVNPTNDMDKKYEDFLDLARWNNQSEKILAGKANAFMPERETYEKLFGKTFGNQVDDFIGVNKELATAASYFLDPTLYLSMGTSGAAKSVGAKVAAAAIKSGEAGNVVGHAVSARAARNAFKASWMNSLGENLVKFSDATTKPIDAMFDTIADNASKVLGTKVHITPNGQGRAARVAAGHAGTKAPTSLVHSAMGAVGMYSVFNIPYALPITSVYAGLKGVGLIGETILDVGRKGLEKSDTAIAKAMKFSSPLAIYMKDLGTTAIHGGFYGGVIGGLAGGEEGAAGGIGTGMALGALGHNIGYAYGTLSGNFAKEALYKEFDTHVAQLREKGHLLKHDRVQQFISRVAQDHGSEEATRAIAHVMTLEKSKNVSVSYMGYGDFAAALSNDAKMWKEVIGPDGKPTKVLSDLGQTIHGALERYGSFEAPVEKIKPEGFIGPMPSERIAHPSQSWNGIFMGKGEDGKPNQKPIAIWQDGQSRRWHIIINTDNVTAARDKFGNIIYDKYQAEGPRPTETYRTPETVQVEGPRVDVTETLPAGIDQYGIPLKSKKERTVVKVAKKDFVGPMPAVNETRWSQTEMQGPMPAVERQRPRVLQAQTAPLGELYHAMNAAYRRVNHGADIVNTVKDWLIGSGGKQGTAFKDRAGTVKFMHEVYRKLGGEGRDATYDGNWRKAIDEFERTGKIESPEVADAFHDFIEELGEAMFIGWESGKPFDYILKGGDLGFARNMVESVKDVFQNRVLREATNLGADVRTSKAFLDWFKKTKDDKNFKFDPVIENAFKDLARTYTAHEMKDAGLGRTDLHKFTPSQLKQHAETYGYEDRLKYDSDGVPSLKSNEQYNAEQHNKGKALNLELGQAFLKNPDLLNGVDLQIVTDGRTDVNANFASLDAASRDPNGSTSDTLGSREGAMLYQSTDFGDVGPSLDDLHAAQKSGADASGVYPPRTSSSYGARGRPRTALTGKMALDLVEAMKTGKKLIMRGIPSDALFKIIEKYIPKTVADNVRMLAPLIVDGGFSKANVVSGSYHGFDQVDKNGVKKSRKSGDSFNARNVNFVPYDLELSWTLDNIKNPTVNYENPHFAYNAKVMDVDALNRRNHILWNENEELRTLYGDVHQFEEDVFRTIDEYSAYKEIPATEFFGDNANARLKRKYVTAAIGAAPNLAHKAMFSVAEAEWHSYQHYDKTATQNHPWHRLRLDGLTGAKSVDGERMRIRVNETQYYRSMKPTPIGDTGPMWRDSTGKPAMYQEGDIVNGVKMTPQVLGRRYDMNSEKWKSGFIGRLAEENQTWVGKDTPAGQVETLKDKVVEFKVGPKFASLSIIEVLKNGKLGDEIAHVTSELRSRDKGRQGQVVKDVAVSTAAWKRNRGWGNIAYSEFLERVRALDFKAFEGEIINSKGWPMRMRDTVAGAGNSYIMGPDWETRIDVATQAEVVRRLDNEIDLSEDHQGVRVSSPIIPSAFYQTESIGDGAIPVNTENLRDFSTSTNGENFNVDSLSKRLDDPSKLVKELGKLKMFKKAKPIMYQMADTFGAKTEAEAAFLKSNFKYAEEKGDVFQSEALRRFLAQFNNADEEVTLVRHSLEEWLKSSGDMETYNANFRTGKPVVIVGTHGTQSIELIKSGEFRGELLGGNTGAKSAERGHFHSGKQTTSHTYGKVEGKIHEVIDTLNNSFRNLVDTIADPRFGDFESYIKNMKYNFEEAMLFTKDAYSREDRAAYRGFLAEAERLLRQVEPELRANERRAKAVNDIWSRIANAVDEKYPKTIEVEGENLQGKYKYTVGSPSSEVSAMMRRLHGQGTSAIHEVVSRLPKEQREFVQSLSEKILHEQSSHKTLWEYINGRDKVLKPLQADAQHAFNKAMGGVRKFASNDFEIQQLRSAIGFKNPLVYDFKGSEYREVKYDTILLQAAKDGHDSVILLNTFDGGLEVDNIYVTLKGNEGTHIAVLDTSLTGKAKRRGINGEEGGRWLQQPPDDMLPAGSFGANNPDTVRIRRSIDASMGKSGDGKFVVKINPAKSFKVGMEYERMKHDPYNPKVRAAYKAFADETLVQMQHIVDAGYVPEMHIKDTEPYRSSAEAIADVRNNKRLKVLSTDLNFGAKKVTPRDITENPLLAMSKFKDANGMPMRINDVFRFVHDFFGHSERGNGFGPLGEENAWDVHARMYSPQARRAMTAGTRGQNSWVNFIHEPNVEINRKRSMVRQLMKEGRVPEALEIQKGIGEIRFADQKIGLMPEWTSKLDEELTPIEKQAYGTHVVSEKTFGLYQGPDDMTHSVWSPEADEFSAAGLEARSASKFGTSVEIKSGPAYAGHRLLMAGDKRAMAAISPSGELGGVVKGVNGTAKDVEAVVKAALSTGRVRWLNAFDTVLPSMYDKFGFEAVARIRFVDDYRPDGWDYAQYSKFNAGRPDVVFMAYVGEGKAKSYERNKDTIPVVESYDDAVVLAQDRASEARNRGHMLQETDLSGPDPFKFNKLRGDTVKEMAFKDTVFEYAEFVRKTDERIKMGQEPRPRNSVLATFFNKNKDKVFGNSVMTWDKVLVWGEPEGGRRSLKRIPIEEFTKEHLADVKEQLIRIDPNFKKEFNKWSQEHHRETEMKAIELARQIADEQAKFEAEGDRLLEESVYANDTPRQKIQRLYRRKYMSKAIDYLRSVGGEKVNSIFKMIDKNYEKTQSKLEAARKEKDERTRKMERIKDKVMAEFYKENEAAEAEGLTAEDDAYPHKEFDDEVHLETIRRYEEAEAKEANIEETFGLKEEDYDPNDIEALTKEDAVMLAEKRAAKHRRNSAEVFGFADEEGNVKAEDVVKYEPMTPEQIETLMKAENEEAYDKEGMRIWDKEEFDSELQKRIKYNDALVDIQKQIAAGTYDPTKATNQNFGTNLKAGSLQYLADYKYANSQWFNDKGESILRQLTLDGKTMMIEGVIPSVHDSKKSGENEIVLKYAGMPDKKVKIKDVPPEVMDEIRKNAISVFPDEYNEVMKRMDEKLQRLREGARLNTPFEHLESMFGLFSLWGWEINPHLLDPNFKAGVSSEGLEGLSGKQVYEETLRQSGVLISGFDRSASFTKALQNQPDLFMSTIEILSSLREGAEYIEKNSKGTIDFEHRVALAKEKGVTIDANMESVGIMQENPIILGWLTDYLRKFPENRELLAEDTSGKIDEKAVERKLDSRWKDYKKDFKKKNGVVPSDEQRKAFKEKTEAKIRAELSFKAGSGELSFVGNFFDQGTGTHHVYGQADSVEYRYYKILKARNDEIKNRNRYIEKDPKTGKHIVDIERGYKPSQLASGEAWKDFQKEAPLFGPILERQAPREEAELKRQAKAVAGEIRYEFIEYMNDEMNRYILDEAEAMQEERGMSLRDWKSLAEKTQEERRAGYSDRDKARTSAVEAAVNEDVPAQPSTPIAKLIGAIDKATTEAEMHEALGITQPKKNKPEKVKYTPPVEAPVQPKVMPMSGERVNESISMLAELGETHPDRPNERIRTVIENGERKAGAFQVSMQGEGDAASLYIDAIYGFEGKGGGRMVMEHILSVADKNEVNVSLEVSPFYSEGGRKMDQAKLMKWYESFGFEPWVEASTPANTYMIRYPREFKGDMTVQKPSAPFSKEALKRNLAFNHTQMPVSGDMYHEPIGPQRPAEGKPQTIDTPRKELSVEDLLDKYQVPTQAPTGQYDRPIGPEKPPTLKLGYTPEPQYSSPIGPQKPIELGYTPVGGNQYDQPIGPRRPAGRPRREKPPVGTPTKAKPVKPTKVEIKKTEATAEKVKKITEATVRNGTVKPVEQVGVAQVVVQAAGPIASVSRENLEHTLAILSIKDHLTLKMSGGAGNPRVATADKRYMVTGKAGKYEVVMQPHQSPYHGQIVDQRRIAIVPTLEHAQLCIREFDTLQRRLAEMQGIDTSAALQATAPVMAPAQIQQVAKQVAQAEAQQPTPPVTSPKTPAEAHPNFNACVVGLNKLRIPRPYAKELVTAAVAALGKDAKIEDIIQHCLHANQVMAAQIATANEIHVATVNNSSGAPNPSGVAQVVVMPSNAGLNNASGSVVPRPPAMGLGYPNSIPSAPVQTATKSMWTPSSDQLMVMNTLIRFNQYMSKIKLPNGGEGVGVTLVNPLGYTIQQTAPSRFRVYGPNKALVSVTDNEQQACDEIFRAHFKR